MASANLELPFIQSAQAQKHVTYNEALARLDALVQLSVTSRSLSVPPVSAVDGERFIIGSGASGAWLGHEGEIAAYQNGGYTFYQPVNGWHCFVEDEDSLLIYRSGVWAGAELGTQTGGRGGSGGAVTSQSVLVTMTGSPISTGLIFPTRSIVLGVTALTTEAVQGGSYDVGFSGEPSKFGGLLGTAQGSKNIGVIGPQAIYSDTEVIISQTTPIAGGFTDGVVQLTSHYIVV